jgi:hypothetical protein
LKAISNFCSAAALSLVAGAGNAEQGQQRLKRASGLDYPPGAATRGGQVTAS